MCTSKLEPITYCVWSCVFTATHSRNFAQETESFSISGYQERQVELSTKLISEGATISNSSDANEFREIEELYAVAYAHTFPKKARDQVKAGKRKQPVRDSGGPSAPPPSDLPPSQSTHQSTHRAALQRTTL